MINEILYWSLYTASAKSIAKKSGRPVQAVLRDAMLIWDTFKVMPHEGLAIYWAGLQGKDEIWLAGEERVLH